MGWIVLTYDPDPVCVWITSHKTCVLKICLDERLFGDTIFRAEKISDTYVISDVFVYNSCSIYSSTTFKQRYDWTKSILERFYRPGLTKLIHKSDLLPDTKLRGYEYYDFNPGSYGSFAEPEETIIRTEIPDVYTVKGKQGYLLVPDLKTSVFLRSKGAEFKLKCNEKNGNWEVILPN
jgi:hypothetical protein